MLPAFQKLILTLLVFVVVAGPAEIFSVAGNSTVKAQTVAPTEKTSVTGVYDVLYEDSKDGNPAEIPTIYDKKSEHAIKLEASGSKIPASYLGKEISIVGALSANTLTYNEEDNQAVFSFSEGAGAESQLAAASIGANTVAVFYVNFADHRERTMSYEGIYDYVFRGYKDFLSRSSNGLFTINGNVYLLDLPLNKTCELISPIGLDGDLIKYTKYEAGLKGINVDSYDHKVIVIDKSLSCERSGKAYRPAEFAYSVGVGSIAHELGHLYGLDHGGAYDCAGSFVESSCELSSRTEYWNYTDIMGSSNEYIDGDYSPYHKHKMGWLQGTQIVNVGSAGGTFTLERYEELPGAPGPYYPTKVLRVETFSGGPAYYISHKRKSLRSGVGREGATLELASGSLDGYKMTALLDTTPGSLADRDDFNDGYIHDGQQVTDAFNGIVFEQISHDTQNAIVSIKRIPPAANSSFMDVPFQMATGYLSAVSRKQDVSWSPVNYVVSLKCTSDFYGCPANLGDKLTTTNTNGDLTLANGFSYEFTVDIYTKKDGDPNSTARYFWYKGYKNNVSCSGGDTCSVNVSWPEVTYKASLVKAGTATKVCNGALGCQDFITTSGTNVSFRGLVAIDGSTDLESVVEIADFSNNVHLLMRVNALGKADDDIYSCSSNESLSCKIGNSSGIGPFVGGEPIMVAVKVTDQYGHLLDGPTLTHANPDGSYSRYWSSIGGNKLWDYFAVVFPSEFDDCYAAGGECQYQSLYDTDEKNFKLLFSGLKQNYPYRVVICAMTCNSNTGNPKIVDEVVRSANITFGPSFFPFDPFDESGGFSGDYFDNSDFTNKKFSRLDKMIAFNWGTGSPDTSISAESYSVRWVGNFYLEEGSYRFNLSSSDKVKIFADGNLILENAGMGSTYNTLVNLDDGYHQIKVEYVQETGSASIVFGFVDASDCYDFNGDYKVSSIDLGVLSKNFGSTGEDLPWDLNGDGKVSSIDLSLESRKFGQTCPIPE